MSKIIVALDGYGKKGKEAFDLAKKLSGKVWGFKVNDLFLRYGVHCIEHLADHGNIMLDLKLYDIPNTVQNGCESLFEAIDGWVTTRLEPEEVHGAGNHRDEIIVNAGLADKVKIVTVHAHGGLEMMKAAVKVLPGKIAAVTVLTSFSQETYNQVCPSTQTIKERVVSLAGLALQAGCSHLVCSPEELVALSGTVAGMGEDVRGGVQIDFSKLKKVIPGIRPLWHQGKDDQKRTATPADAVKNGADLLVIGRPITQAEDPVAAVEKTNAEIGG